MNNDGRTQNITARKASHDQLKRFYKLPDPLVDKLRFLSSTPPPGHIFIRSNTARTKNETGFWHVIEGTLELGVTKGIGEHAVFHKIMDLTVPQDSESTDWVGIYFPREQTVNKFAIRSGQGLILLRMPYTSPVQASQDPKTNSISVDFLLANEKLAGVFYSAQRRLILQLLDNMCEFPEHSRLQIKFLASIMVEKFKQIHAQANPKEVAMLVDLLSEMIGILGVRKGQGNEKSKMNLGAQNLFHDLFAQYASKMLLNETNEDAQAR